MLEARLIRGHKKPGLVGHVSFACSSRSFSRKIHSASRLSPSLPRRFVSRAFLGDSACVSIDGSPRRLRWWTVRLSISPRRLRLSAFDISVAILDDSSTTLHGSGDMLGRSKQRTTPSDKFQLQNSVKGGYYQVCHGSLNQTCQACSVVMLSCDSSVTRVVAI
ncbi:hypothetical protein Bca52824_067423 [Brassica carinata]|uniref:Uncharacterized protein n=1 Tax=Brassica carinata TaxID=52824 RepID=A0A8X7QSD4_BRACI|nr:hypothetical protein Bca52824_067423 [Brassica carinata]